jgi:hypothetical protein
MSLQQIWGPGPNAAFDMLYCVETIDTSQVIYHHTGNGNSALPISKQEYLNKKKRRGKSYLFIFKLFNDIFQI